MKTPIFDFVNDYKEKKFSRLHMPGHKGLSFLGCESNDITEIHDADSLYETDGIIRESEMNATKLFKTGKTLYSTEGSSHVIRSMIFIAYQIRNKSIKKPYILAARNVHKSFLYAVSLIDCEISWIYPTNDSKNSICSCHVTPLQIEKELQKANELPFAVYITSPDYLGECSDVESIANVCKKYNVPLLCDNAHGAYLGFLKPSEHPIKLGAFMCSDSAHKTLPVLTGGAYLHLSKEANKIIGENAKNVMAITGSTSPSYITLQSLDLCNKYLSEIFETDLEKCIINLNFLKDNLKKRGLRILDGEKTKLVIDAASMGYTGDELASIIRKNNGEPEFADSDYLVCMFTPQNNEDDYLCVLNSFSKLEKRTPLKKTPLRHFSLPQKMSIRDAIFSMQEIVPIEQSVGRICGEPTISCPPAVPIVISGEYISAEVIPIFKSYGIKQICVVK